MFKFKEKLIDKCNKYYLTPNFKEIKLETHKSIKVYKAYFKFINDKKISKIANKSKEKIKLKYHIYNKSILKISNYKEGD